MITSVSHRCLLCIRMHVCVYVFGIDVDVDVGLDVGLGLWSGLNCRLDLNANGVPRSIYKLLRQMLE